MYAAIHGGVSPRGDYGRWMTLRKSVHPAPEHLDPQALRSFEGGLVLLPDTLSRVDGQMVAGFRDGAQALRARAKEEGIPVAAVVPAGARAGRYSEHAADWVLPLILGVPAGVVAQLLVNEIQRWLDRWRDQGRSRVPTLRYREVVVDRGTDHAAIREIEGPADEVADWIGRRSAVDAELEATEEEWKWPRGE